MLKMRSTLWLSALLFAAVVARPSAQATAQAAKTAESALPPPVHLTSEQDHLRTMDLAGNSRYSPKGGGICDLHSDQRAGR